MDDTIPVYGTVILAGCFTGLNAVKEELGDRFCCTHYRPGALLVNDVTAAELTEITRLATGNDVVIDQVRDQYSVRLAADKADQTKQPNLSVMAGGWYKTNQDTFPLIHVIEVRNQIDASGVELWLFDVDLVAGDALPMAVTMDAKQLSTYKPKPASIADFEELDIAPPADFGDNPHAIPFVGDKFEPVTASVSPPSWWQYVVKAR